jgi:8-amino-7-oxononanoate synthase
MYNDHFLEKKINERKANNAFRTLRLSSDKIDFHSNDYLGIAHHQLIKPNHMVMNHGSKGSRLLSGNYILIEQAEKSIAEFHLAEAGLIFNSGYDANLGLLSCVPQRVDTILYDFLCHASIRDGIRLSNAQSYSFEHNNLADLTKKLTIATGTIFIVTESVFSMDGDMADLPALVSIAQEYNAHLIIDEAHATGIIGNNGEGLVQSLGLSDQVFARVHTFGKALGCHGAVVLGSAILKDYLINFARSFIYSTALPPVAIDAIIQSYALFPIMEKERQHIQLLINYFANSTIRFEKLPSKTPIQILIVPGNDAVKILANQLQDEGLDVRAILYPTVPKNSERLRIILHSFNTIEQLDQLIKHLQ